MDKYSLHPPFIYHLYCTVIKNKKNYYCFGQIEEIRKNILQDDTLINIQDYGSGSRSTSKNQRKVKDIARTGLSSAKFSQLLFRLAEHFKPKVVLELGTSLGINTLYLGSHSADCKIYTFEGCTETADYAEKVFDLLKVKNIELVRGNIDINLPLVADALENIDFIYFDANHRYKPTISYFETALLKAHDKSLFIFDDIHWSSEMEEAWETIKKHPKVTMTIDIFDAGLVFFDRNLNYEQYILEF